MRLPTSKFNKLEARKIKQREGLQLLATGLQYANRVVNIVLSRFIRERETKGALGTFGRQPHRNKHVRGLAFVARAGTSARCAYAHYSKKQLVLRLEQSIAKRTTIDASPEGLPIGRPRTAFRPCPKRARGVLPTRAPLFPTTDRKLPGLPPR